MISMLQKSHREIKMALRQYPMRIEELLWRKAKSKAALEGMTLREALETLLRLWIDGKVDVEVKK